MVLKFEFEEMRAGWEARIIDSQGVSHKVKGIYPTVDEAEKGIIRLLERET